MPARMLRSAVVLLFSSAIPWVAAAASTERLIDEAMVGDHRSAETTGRDKYLHPKQTLLFFVVTPDMTVVEISPSRGWYTEILAPLLRDGGQYYAAVTAI